MRPCNVLSEKASMKRDGEVFWGTEVVLPLDQQGIPGASTFMLRTLTTIC